jgi:hypothetical protein
MLFATNGCKLSKKLSIKSKTTGELGPDAGCIIDKR